MELSAKRGAVHKVWLSAMATLMTACAPIRPEVLDSAMSSPAPGHFPVSVERGKWAGINSVPLGVFVDGKLAGTLGGGQALTLYLTEGRHTVGVGANGHSPRQARPSDEVIVDVSKSSEPILETNVSALGYGGWKIKRLIQ